MALTQISTNGIKDANVNTADIADNAVTTDKIASGAINNSKIDAGAVTTASLGTNAVTAAKIADNTITAQEIADNAVSNNELASNAVARANIQDAEVIESKIAANAVSTAKIPDGAITNAKLASGSVGTNKLASGAVGSGEIAAGSIVNSNISSSAAIAGTKIDPSFTSDITISNVAPQLFLTDTNSASDFVIQNDNGNLNFRDTSNTADRLRIDASGNFNFVVNGGDNRISRDTTSGGPYLLFHNRGTGTTDSSGIYNMGGISAAGYRDVANPSIIGSIQFERQPTAGGASSGCNITFRTGFNGTTSHTGVGVNMLLNYSGNLGVGSLTPQARADINAPASSVGLRVTGGESGGTNIAQFRTANGTERLTINNHVRIANGNLIMGGAGTGVDFSVNPSAGGATGQILNDYEEGTWTPAGFCDGGGLTVQGATYTKIGQVVYIYMYINSINIPNTACEWRITGLPFTVTSANDHYPPLTVGYSGAGNLPAEITFLFRANNTFIYSHTTAGQNSTRTNQHIRAYIQGQQLILSGFYFTDA